MKLVLLFLVFAAAFCRPWKPEFAGSGAHNATFDGSAKKEFNIRWKYGADPIRGGAVADSKGTIYFGDDSGTVTSLVSSKLVKWLGIDFPSKKWTYRANDVVSTFPLLTPKEDLVIVGSRDKHLYAIFTATGKLAWKVSLMGAVDSDPMFYNETVFFGDQVGYINAVRPDNGTVLWKCKTKSSIITAPAFGPDGSMYVSSADTNVYAFDPNPGKGCEGVSLCQDCISMRWKHSVGTTAINSSPMIANGMLYVGRMGNEGSDGGIVALSLQWGDEVWSFSTGIESVESSPSLIPGATPRDSLVVAGSANGTVFAVNATSGKLAWMAKTGEDVVCHPVVTKDAVLVSSGDKHVHAFDPRTGKLLWKKDLGENLVASLSPGPHGSFLLGGMSGNLFSLGGGQWGLGVDAGTFKILLFALAGLAALALLVVGCCICRCLCCKAAESGDDEARRGLLAGGKRRPIDGPEVTVEVSQSGYAPPAPFSTDEPLLGDGMSVEQRAEDGWTEVTVEVQGSLGVR